MHLQGIIQIFKLLFLPWNADDTFIFTFNFTLKQGEAKGLMDKLSRPGDLTYGDVATGFICGVQVFGCFCIGEMVGRQNIQGYKVKGDHFDHHH